MERGFKWNNCEPGNMPEDLYPELITTISRNGNLFIGPFIGVNLYQNKYESYCICSRYKPKNGNRWTWSGLHPIAWSMIPNYNSQYEQFK